MLEASRQASAAEAGLTDSRLSESPLDNHLRAEVYALETLSRIEKTWFKVIDEYFAKTALEALRALAPFYRSILNPVTEPSQR